MSWTPKGRLALNIRGVPKKCRKTSNVYKLYVFGNPFLCQNLILICRYRLSVLWRVTFWGRWGSLGLVKQVDLTLLNQDIFCAMKLPLNKKAYRYLNFSLCFCFHFFLINSAWTRIHVSLNNCIHKTIKSVDSITFGQLNSFL